RQTVWTLAKVLWPDETHEWPTITLGTILGCGSLFLQQTNHHDERRTEQKPARGPFRLLRILISESAYLMCVLRCERTIQGLSHTIENITSRWCRKINNRLQLD
ncbi:hypothetical protein HYDPIDRAFT_45670, partial [Hydnomerulius pinastri MD-312]